MLAKATRVFDPASAVGLPKMQENARECKTFGDFLKQEFDIANMYSTSRHNSHLGRILSRSPDQIRLLCSATVNIIGTIPRLW